MCVELEHFIHKSTHTFRLHIQTMSIHTNIEKDYELEKKKKKKTPSMRRDNFELKFY